MKRQLTAIAAAALTLGTLAPAAFAATTSSPSYFKNTISVGSYSANVEGITVKDAGNTTALFPFFYIQQGLNALGYKVTWDGVAKRLDITTPSGVTVNTSNLNPGVGAAGIYINGTLVQNAPFQVANDMGGNKKPTSFMSAFYLNKALNRAGIVNHYDGAAGQWKMWSNDFSINGAGTLAIGGKDTLTLTAKSETVDASKVTWSLDSSAAGKAFMDANGNFTATAAGTYTVTASYDNNTFTQNVVVYGDAVGYKITSDASSLLADNATENTITVTAVDANGNPALGYNGKAIVADTGSLFAPIGDQPSDFSIVSGTNYIQFTNGVATFAVGPTSSVNVSDTITVTDTATSNPLTGATYTFSSATSVLSKLDLAVASGSPSAISANGQYSTTLTLSAENTAGNTFSGQPGTYVNLSLTGPGSFVAGTTPVTSETVYVPTSGSLPITVYSEPGQPGSVAVSATATGLTSASLTVPTWINTAANSLSVTSKAGTDSNGNSYTLYTVQLLDTNGHPITTTAANDAFTVTDNSAAGLGQLTYGSVNSSGVFSGSASSLTSALVNGIATFAVETKYVGSGAPTLTVTDTTNSLTQTAAYSYNAGAAAHLDVTPSTTVFNVKPGQTVTFSAQLADTYDNAVSKAGVPVTFSFDTPLAGVQFPTGQSTYTVNTNSSGVASVSFTIPSTSSAGALKLHAASGSLTAGDSASLTVLSATDTSNYATSVGVKDGSGNALTSTSATSDAAHPGTINVTAKNAVGAAVGNNDVFKITSSNSSVVSVTTSTESSTAGVLSGLESDLNIGTVGSAVITVQDISNQDAPKVTFTVNVNPGVHSGALVEYNGAVLSASNTATLAAGGNVALQIVNADAKGNPLPVAGSSAMTVNLSSSLAGDFRLSPTGAPVTSVKINPGQSSVAVYFVSSSSSAQTLNNSATQFTATEVSSALFSMSGLTYASEVGSASAGGSFAAPTAAVGHDVNGNTVAATGGVYTISGVPATTLVSIDSSTGAVTIGTGAQTGTYVVTYTVGSVSTTASITVS